MSKSNTAPLLSLAEDLLHLAGKQPTAQRSAFLLPASHALGLASRRGACDGRLAGLRALLQSLTTLTVDATLARGAALWAGARATRP